MNDKTHNLLYDRSTECVCAVKPNHAHIQCAADNKVPKLKLFQSKW